MMQIAVLLIASLLILGAALGTASRALAAPPAKSAVSTQVKNGWIKGALTMRHYEKIRNLACADIVVQAFDTAGRLVGQTRASGALDSCAYSLKVVPTGDISLGATIPQPAADLHESLGTPWYKQNAKMFMKLKPPPIKLTVTNKWIKYDKWSASQEVIMPLYVDGVQE